ncbi:T9SS type A sorting domain-containing protein [Hymenobacter sp. GOD-10R]|uniref:T9SS type A sorting domain-containing protein n=1 Tax=Hymenobacter sp. GOD-10R TaxID=3093922 RepID=UPI002D79291E|nr:T9SS type A sorting domain-containing protein [Hymenobacter sp. GOD-10R]WRQ29935.1 T9SS type A sorting domain-containing protein [Hymenobacter sp. GOD-10R]
MKNHLHTLLCAAGLLSAGGATAQTTVPNAGFETWENRPLSNERPQGWLTADDIVYQVFQPIVGPLTPNATKLVTKSSDKYTGSFAAQLIPKNISVLGLGSQPAPAILLLGDRFRVTFADLSDPTALADIRRSRGIPYTARPAQLTFWYKFAGTSTDQAQVAMALSKGNLSNGGIIVGTASSTTTNVITPGTTTYKQFSVPITYTSTEAPDSLRLGFSVGGNQVFSSSAALTIDDVAFSFTTANASPAVAATLSVYPNPSENGLFSLASLQKASVATAPLSVTDALGKVVLQQAAAPASAANGRQLDLRGKPAGVYLLRLDTPEGIVVRKLQLQ